jgi:HSP20 family protein
MSWRYQNRKRRDEDDNGEDSFFGPFDFGFAFPNIDRMIEGMFNTVSSFEGKMKQNPNTVFYGYQVTIGPDGKPLVREFGNVKPAQQGTFAAASREPFVDTLIDDKEHALKVVAEMPGIRKEDIKLEVRDNSLVIKAENNDRKYNTAVPLSSPVEADSAKASYNNGILEVKLKLKSPPKPKGVSIKVD